MAIPVIGLFVYPNINPFHFSIPHIIFNIKIEDKPLFELKIFSISLILLGFLEIILSIILINEFFSIDPSLSNIFSNFIIYFFRF